MPRLMFVVSEDWYFVTHRLQLAVAAKSHGYTVSVLTNISKHREEIESLGIEVFEWNLIRISKNPVKELKAIKRLADTISLFKPDLIHAVAIKPTLYAALAGKIKGVKSLVYALGGLGFIFSSGSLLAKLTRPLVIMAFKIAFAGKHTRLILQTEHDKATVLSHRLLKNDNIRIVRGAGVDTELFKPSADRNSTPVVVLSGRLLWNKGVREFIECAKAIRSRDIDAQFILVGEPDLQNPDSVPHAEIKSWVDQKLIEWWGRRSDMHHVLQCCDIFCLPSTYGEGVPKSLLEAASCGMPIITFDIPGCRDIVTDGINGILIDVNKPQNLLNAVEYLLTNSDVRKRMGKSGRELVLRSFSQEQIFSETIAIWNSLLET